jgi:hypothetical protein
MVMVAKGKSKAKGSKAKVGMEKQFRPEYIRQARQLGALGLTVREIADFFEVDFATFCCWDVEHGGLLDAANMGIGAAHSRVTWSLYRRAVGYTYEATKIFQPRREGAPPMIVPYDVHVPPDTKAAIFWLRTLRPDQWGDKPNREAPSQSLAPPEDKELRYSPELMKIFEDMVAEFPDRPYKVPDPVIRAGNETSGT